MRVIDGNILWQMVKRSDEKRRKGDRLALEKGRITRKQLRDRNFAFPGTVRFQNTELADRALVKCLKENNRNR